MGEIIFTIITPTFNAEEYIEKSLESVVNQSESLFEYIIIDGMSSDNTMQIVKKYSKEFPNIKYLVEKDYGIYDAMNKGINLARGRFIYFLGAGDRLKPNILRDIYEIIPKDYPEIIYGNVYMEDLDRIHDGKFNKYKLSINNICHQSIFFNKSIFERYGLYELKYPILSDHAYNIKVFFDKDIRVKFINKIIAIYQGNGISQIVVDKIFIKEQSIIVKKYLGTLPFIYLSITKLLRWLIK